MQIKKKYHFYAGHRNKHAGEKCARLHGHTYDVLCYFEFENKLDKSGVTFLFSDIDKLVEPIIKSFDHYFLVYKEDPLAFVLASAGEPYIELPFETSAENMATHIFNLIKETGLNIVKIELAETKSSTVIYNGETIN